MVHRDIKPGNVMLTPNGVKILDFGISVAAGEPDDDDTGATFGTPAYVAPERLDGMPAEPATDVYGAGRAAVRDGHRRPAVPGGDLGGAGDGPRCRAVRAAPVAAGRLPRDVVDRCLDDDPAERPTAARVRADLLAVALRLAVRGPGSAETATPVTTAATDAASFGWSRDQSLGLPGGLDGVRVGLQRTAARP